MADKYVNSTDLSYYHNRIAALFALAEDVPTAVSDLTNDEGFVTATVNNLANYYLKTETYTQAQVDALIASITGVQFEIVQSLPATGSAGTIYLVASSGTGQNVYDEYIYVSNNWEKIGSTDVDLSQYWSKSELVAMTTAEIDALFA